MSGGPFLPLMKRLPSCARPLGGYAIPVLLKLTQWLFLPDHLHCIWTLPPDDADFATRWRLIKTWFTKHCHAALRVIPGAARASKQEQAVWQHHYWEHLIRDDHDYARHVDNIHYNSVKHGLTASPMAWPYSSFCKHVAAGIYPANWGQTDMTFDGIGRE